MSFQNQQLIISLVLKGVRSKQTRVLPLFRCGNTLSYMRWKRNLSIPISSRSLNLTWVPFMSYVYQTMGRSLTLCSTRNQGKERNRTGSHLPFSLFHNGKTGRGERKRRDPGPLVISTVGYLCSHWKWVPRSPPSYVLISVNGHVLGSKGGTT